ncbi:MAG: DUF190 domain-containing protein [Vicinamibacterales bacterium]
MTARMKKMLVVILKEGDVWQGAPVYERFVQLLHQSRVAGATVTPGIMGFGRHYRIHHKGLFGVADDRPVTIVAVDYEEVLRTAVEQSRDMLDSALTLMLDVELM